MQNDDLRTLWLAVILQLIDDYVSHKPVCGNSEEGRAAKIQAIEWFQGNSLDYKETCSFAGINSDWLRQLVLNSSKEKLHAIREDFRSIIRGS